MPRRKKGTGSGGGRPMTHGLRKLERHFKDGRLDRRGGIAQLWKRRVLEWADDAGGLPHMTAREQTLLWHTAATSLLIDSLLNWTFVQPSLLDANSEMLNPLRKSLIAYLNAERRGLEALGMKPGRPDAIPSLQEYIAARSGNGNGMPDAPAGPESDEQSEGGAELPTGTVEAAEAPCACGCVDCRCGVAVVTSQFTNDGEEVS